MCALHSVLSLVRTPRSLFPTATAPGPLGSRPRPEDDILFQWRLRRKMEQARQWSHTSSHSSALHQPLLSRLALQVNKDEFTYGLMIISVIATLAVFPFKRHSLGSLLHLHPWKQQAA